jgi:hypothetical protein
VSQAGGWFGCADSARLRADPLIGTAPYALGWLLIEHPGPWKPEALAGSGIAPHVRRVLADAARSSGSRILLIRRPGRQRSGDDRRWAAVSSARGTTWGRWADEEDLLAAADALAAPGSAARVRDPILLVCAHGLHDTCCAVRGRPVTAALADLWPTQTWECSHVGGDRFAANVVILPDGAYYGNLDGATAVATVREHLAGRLALPHLRGLAGFAPVVQVGVGAAHEHFGPWGAGEVTLIASAEQVPHRRWQIDLHSPTGPLRAVVSISTRPHARLTCRAPLDSSATEFHLDSLTRL